MGIYNGIDGVVRQTSEIHSQLGSVQYHISSGHAGIDNVNRQVYYDNNIKDILIDVQNVTVYDFDTSVSENPPLTLFGSGLSTANQYGNVNVGSNYVQVSCHTSGKYIYVSGSVFIRFNDDHRTYIHLFANQSGLPIQFSVTHNASCGSGYIIFLNEIFNARPLVSFWDSGSQTYTHTEFPNSNVSIAFGSRSTSGQTSQYYNSCTINGINYPITVVNSLT